MTDKEIAEEAAKHASKHEKEHSGNWMTAFNSFIMGCKLALSKKKEDTIGEIKEGWAVRK